MAAPGWVDPNTGVILKAGNLKWTEFPLKAKINKRFQLPTNVMNDSNAAALGEYYCGRHSSDHFMCITLGTGIGAGIILDGKLHSGNRFRAGEIGHAMPRSHCKEFTVNSGRILMPIGQENENHNAIYMG